MSKKVRNKKYIFTLENIDMKIDQKYSLMNISNITTSTEPINNNITKISELKDLNPENVIVSFLDETKRLHQCKVSMIDFSSGKDVLLMKYHCYWCRHSFDTDPIGCPINYISNKAVKKYYSEVSKDNYIIKENITKYKRNFLNIKNNSQQIFIPNNNSLSTINIDKNEYYETDGVFCSFNCCKAFINDNKHHYVYQHSNLLLLKLYYDIVKNDNSVININPAPHWRLLTEYGGYLSINQFRENFNKAIYEYQGICKFKAVGSLYEEKINF
jgi:hypothetical protein